MIQYQLKEPGKVCPEQAAVPTPGDAEALIRVKHVGICGSDIHLFHGTYNGPHHYPMLFGHEWSGVVEKVGKDVTRVAVGDIVTGDCSRFCGSCGNCEEDKNLCSSIEKFGITIDGASAEYITRDQRYLYRAPEGLREDLLCLSEPVAVAAHLISKVKHTVPSLAGKRILVLGGGVIGMAAMMLLSYTEGCEAVELFDIAQSRAELARSVGARIPDAAELNPGDGQDYASMYASAKYDIVLETTGNAGVFSNAFHLVKPAGVLGCVGMIASVQIPQKLIVTKSLTVVGSIGGTGDFPAAMKFLQEHSGVAQKLISHHFPIEEISQAFETACNPNGTMKVCLDL